MIGRKKEVEELERLYGSSKAEFVAVYGRRRVGKTYLVGETFKNRFTFSHAGLSPIEGRNGKNMSLSNLREKRRGQPLLKNHGAGEQDSQLLRSDWHRKT